MTKPTKKKYQKWEYIDIEFTATEDLINRGEEGWELVAVDTMHYESRDGLEHVTRAYFKRPLL